MNRKQIITYSIIAIAALSTVAAFNDPFVYNKTLFVLGTDIPYTASDISLSNPNIVGSQGSASYIAEFVTDIKDRVDYTVHGTVTSIGDPIPWTDNVGNSRGIIPIELEVKQVTKGSLDSKTFTVHLLSNSADNKWYLSPGNPDFELGEEVIVHITVESPDEEIGNLNLVALGEYAKYKIEDGRAYNVQFPYGKTIDGAINEAR